MTRPKARVVVLGLARDDDDESELVVYVDPDEGCLRLRPVDADDALGSSDEAVPAVRCGVWRHRSGQDYLVLGVGIDDRGGEPRVVYARLYGRPGLPLTARRHSAFSDADADGPRFTWVGARQDG